MKQQLLIILFLFPCLSIYSQERLINCISEQNSDRSISIYADSRADGEYTVKLSFNNLSGYRSNTNADGSLITVYKGRREIARLTPDKNASSFVFNYRFSYFAGAAQRKRPDTSISYLLPAPQGAKLRISGVSLLAKDLGQKVTDEFYSTGFQYHLSDTICAARAGTILTANDAVKEGETISQYFRRERNTIEIQQRDGTLARYQLLAPIQLLVSQGETVIPGQPIAVFNKPGEKYTLIFSVSYLDEKRALAEYNIDVPTAPGNHPYISQPVYFYVSPAEKAIRLPLGMIYESRHPSELVGAELTKKEKKKLGL